MLARHPRACSSYLHKCYIVGMAAVTVNEETAGRALIGHAPASPAGPAPDEAQV